MSKKQARKRQAKKKPTIKIPAGYRRIKVGEVLPDGTMLLHNETCPPICEYENGEIAPSVRVGDVLPRGVPGVYLAPKKG